MKLTDQFRSLLTRLQTQSPDGFAAAFQVVFATPKYLFQTYDEGWMTYYSQMGIVMKDPAVKWGFTHDGIAPWSELEKLDEHGVFIKAAEFGLNYWTVMATSEHGSKSIGAFSRSDRDFTQAEREQIFADFQSLHVLTLQGPETEPDFGEMLVDLSIWHTHPKA
ncbi:autoinducer binding domain-containing protein [Oceaniglobus ichthyenteri]|uniref:autoinducer binding domain-containing protein n=1 Tax=Oceaniglobus ichthyenteri TaxID=2136177 RepID=UPI000D36BCA9|nr:autoinducer binding domain-containing protein [Oceaniglobus ichthyenteri]